MADKRFHRNIIIFHLIFYPLFIYFMNMCILVPKSYPSVLTAIDILMGIGGFISMFITGIYPLYKLNQNK